MKQIDVNRAKELCIMVSNKEINKLPVSRKDIGVFRTFILKAKTLKLIEFPNGAGEIVRV